MQVYDHKHQCKLALKVIRNKRRFHHQAMVEVNILQRLLDAVWRNCCVAHMLLKDLICVVTGSIRRGACGQDARALYLSQPLVHCV